jgi:acyl-CoA reductase-like NAD-dependent aldehyde dehydrogenase
MVEWANIDSSIDLLEELAGAISLATNGVVPHTRDDNTFALVVKEPYGVHLGIAPWNASLFLAMRAVLTPIACGNTAILKASEFSPAGQNFIARMLADVGFPPGVLNVIQHRREDAPQVIEAMIAHPAVKKVNFTGSTSVGKTIAGMAAKYCKPTLMELGGKAPQIVLEDADLDEAAKAAITGAYLHVSLIRCSFQKRRLQRPRLLLPFGTYCSHPQRYH